ncbi:ATP-binding protein [Thermaerobacillus caldiproteolyticus]|uniref:histidine kinase n=1 Tax=Thermaerobacillus caldiproteolyticus TaxID=247480 RepID=A0A7V9Z725_9BACL|nr:ATP-binding protein [Anoxybacillus caldiproteolyticus]MBA2875223.1 PAS domain S-box-containing protein [Anoxybacillus caldiproteolyticus]
MGVTGYHDLKILALFMIVAIISFCLSLNVLLRTIHGQTNRTIWILIGATTIGLGIWSMHFIGMLGYQLDNTALTIFSLFLAVLGPFFALYFVRRSKAKFSAVIIGSIFIGMSMILMHYVGMSYLETGLSIYCNKYLILLSIIAAFSVSFLSVFFSFFFINHHSKYNFLKKMACSVMVGSGLSAMHYTVMKGISFCYIQGDMDFGIRSSALMVSINHLTYVIGFIILIILLATIFIACADRDGVLKLKELTEVHYKCLFDYSPSLVLSVNLRGVIMSVNPKGTELLGGNTDELISTSFYSFFPEKEHKKIKEGFRKIEQGNSCSFVASIIDKYGKEIPMQITLIPIVYNEKTIGLFAVGRDITELLKYKVRIEKAQRDLQDTVRRQQGLIFKFVKKGESFIHTLCGGELLRKLGLSSRDIIGKTLHDFFPKSIADQKMAYYQQAWEGQTLYCEGNINGISYLASLCPVKKNGKVIEVIGSAIDITERKNMEQAIIRAKEEAEKANEAKSELISKMSHELRTPLNGILGFAQLLEMDHSLNSQQREFVQEILNGARHLVNLVNEILDLARIETGKLKITYDVIRPDSIIDESIKLIQPLANKRNIQIINQVRLDEHDYVYIDSTRFRQILLNLLDNAVKYNRENGRVIITGRSEGGKIYIHVKDSGIGIPEEECDRIFEPFYRIQGTGVDGTGIGLAFVKQLIQLMGGSIGVESKLGVGSDFWISLPAMKDITFSSERLNYTHLYVERLSQMGRKNILYIEDNLANLKLMEKIFESFPSFSLFSANCGRDGLDIAFKERIDLILVDINLPDINGYKVLEELQRNERTNKIPVVALSANAMPIEIQKALKKGFKEYITKPLEVEQFLRKLEQIFAQDEM